MSFRGVSLVSFCGALSIPLLLVPGCGGDGLGGELKARPTPRALSKADGQTIRLPQDEPFSITFAPSQQSPGLGGEAEADAHVSRDGSADAAAEVRNGGTAQAGFQLGHAFRNDSDRQMKMDVRVRCRFETEAKAEPPGPLPAAKVSLKLYARDGHNRLLRNFSLAQHSTEEGAASGTDVKDVGFVMTLGPRESVNVFLEGAVAIDTPDDHSASGSIKLGGLEMEVKTETAPPVGSADDEQA